MVPGHYKKRQGQTINIPTDQNLATLNYPSRIQDHAKANPNSSLLHSKMSEKYPRNRSVRTTGPLIPGPIRMDPFVSSPNTHVLESYEIFEKKKIPGSDYFMSFSICCHF